MEGPPKIFCSTCGSKSTENLRQCKGCHSISYCSTACQKFNWPVHKYICKKIAGASPKPPPTDKNEPHVRLIYIPQTGKEPEVVWCPIVDKGNVHIPRIEIFFGYEKNKHPRTESNTCFRATCAHGEHLGYYLSIIFRDIAWPNPEVPVEKEPNQLLAKLTDGARRVIGIQPRGPVFIVGEDSPEEYGDVTAADFGHVIDHIMGPTADRFVSLCRRVPSSAGRKVQAVRINCNGEVRTKGGKFVPVMIPETEPCFRSDYPNPLVASRTTSQISRMLGFEVKSVVFSTDPKIDTDNQFATFLYPDVGPDSDLFMFAPDYWQQGVGTVVVFRTDKKDLTEAQVEVLTDFCFSGLESVFEKGGPQTIEEDINKEVFQKYFERYKRSQIMNGIEVSKWKDAVSPYEMD